MKVQEQSTLRIGHFNFIVDFHHNPILNYQFRFLLNAH